MSKLAFSRSDVWAINGRMSRKSGPSTIAKSNSISPLRLPTSPVAAKIMREMGVSDKKMSEAYRGAKALTIKPKG